MYSCSPSEKTVELSMRQALKSQQTSDRVEHLDHMLVGAELREIARWRESGEVAYERDFALRLTLDGEKIVRILVLPGGTPAP